MCLTLLYVDVVSSAEHGLHGKERWKYGKMMMMLMIMMMMMMTTTTTTMMMMMMMILREQPSAILHNIFTTVR